jgi:hypothetical protein
MKNKSCIICGETANLEEHHTKPRKEGGYKTIPLCHQHHIDVENIKLAIQILKKERKISLRRFKQVVSSFENLGLVE